MRTQITTVLTGLLLLPGCEPMGSRSEMRSAVVEVAGLGEADGTHAEIIELTTQFTLGQGVAAAAQELHDFVVSQVPCSTVTLEDHTLTIDFGDLEDECTYRGRTFAGVVTIAIDRADDLVVVQHTYTGLTGGRVTLDGTAQVTWDGNTRHVVTDLEFGSSRGQWHVEGDRTQVFSACEGVDAVCVDIDGERQWTGPRGEWDMTIAGVHARSIDPVPEAGAYTVVTPQGREFVLSFERVDDDTIAVIVTGGRHDFTFHVTSDGDVEE